MPTGHRYASDAAHEGRRPAWDDGVVPSTVGLGAYGAA